MNQMKVISIFTILICCAFGLKAQKMVFPVEVDYDVYLNYKDISESKATLAFNSEYAYYTHKTSGSKSGEGKDSENENNESKGSDYKVNTQLASESSIFTDRANNLIIEQCPGFDKQMYLIKEETDAIQWTITDEVKDIDQYLCNKATGRFRGRNYTAWFTTEIPTYFGPYKMHGLPGLILELTDDTGEVMFIAKKINVVNKPFEWIEPDYPQITKVELNNKNKKHTEDLYKRVLSRMDRGVKVSISKPTLKGIEIYE